MTTFNITEDLQIECRVFNTSRSWGHTARVLRDNGGGYYVEVGKRRTVYLNRTWERWPFESMLYECMTLRALTKDEKKAIETYIKEHPYG